MARQQLKQISRVCRATSKEKAMTDIVRYENGMDLPSLGAVLAKSKFFSDTTDAAQAIVKVLAGQELGIGPIAAMTGVYIVKGRVAIGANLMAAAVKRSGKYDYRIIDHSDQVCRIVFFEAGQQIGESTFTLADARKAGTQNIDKFPRNMLFARAMSNGVRWYTPDVFSTAVYTPDELRSDQPLPTMELPPAPQVNAATGEVAAVTLTGVVSGVENRYSANGQLWMQFHIGTCRVLFAASDAAWLELQDGDEVIALGRDRDDHFRAETVTLAGVNADETVALFGDRAEGETMGEG